MTFTSATLSHFVVFVIGASGQRCVIIVRGASSTGYTILSNNTNLLTVTASGRDLTITAAATAGAEAGVYALVLSGTVS